MTRKIIGITGKLGSGKDTLGLFFRYYFANIEHLAFATPIKQMLIDYFGFTHDMCYDPIKKNEYNEYWEMTNREAMQKIGTECFRNNFHKDTWVKLAELKLRKDDTKTYLFTDVRFNNEAEMIKDNGGIIIQVLKNNEEKLPWYKKIFKHTHASEKPIDPNYVDFVIKNTSTLQYLYSYTIKHLFIDILKEKYLLDTSNDLATNSHIVSLIKNYESFRGLGNIIPICWNTNMNIQQDLSMKFPKEISVLRDIADSNGFTEIYKQSTHSL